MTDPDIILDAHNAEALSNAHDRWLNPPTEDHIGEANEMIVNGFFTKSVKMDEGDEN